MNIEITDNTAQMIAYGKQLADAYQELYPPQMFDDIRKKNEAYFRTTQEIYDKIYCAIYCNYLYGTTIEEYGLFGFDGKPHCEKLQYLTRTNRIPYMRYLNRTSDLFLLDDKYNAYRLLKPFYRREAMLLSGEQDYSAFCEFTRKHQSIFVKPVNLAFAEGVRRVSICEQTDIRALFEELLIEAEHLASDEVSRPIIHKLILEEEIVPSAEIAQFNPNEMSVVRATTVLANGTVHFFYPCFRMMLGDGKERRGEAYSMNALIDAETGVITTDGVHSFFRAEYHPVSGVKIKGFVMPEWDKLKQMLNAAAHLFPTIRYIGWDVVHTDKGWCIIEGNPGGECFYQMCAGRGLKEEFSRLIGFEA